MNSEQDNAGRLDIAQYAGILLFIVLLESHVVSRAVAFLLGPLVVWLCLFVASPVARGRWRRTLPLAILVSAVGYLLVHYVFTRSG